VFDASQTCLNLYWKISDDVSLHQENTKKKLLSCLLSVLLCIREKAQRCARFGARLDHLSLLQPQGDGVVRDAKLADSLLNGDLVEKHKCAKFAQSS